MICGYSDGSPPVFVQDGAIFISSNVDGEEHGFALTDLQATDVAMKLLAASAKLTGPEINTHDASSVEIFSGTVDGELWVKLIFIIGDAPIGLTIRLEQFDDLAAGIAAVQKAIDKEAIVPRKLSDLE